MSPTPWTICLMLSGGLVFGALMARQGMRPMVGLLVGRESTVS